MKTKYFRRDTRKFGEGENPTFWLGGGEPTPVPPLWRNLKSRQNMDKKNK